MPLPTLPLLNERIYSPCKIAALVEVLSEQGIASEDSLKGSGVDVDKIYDACALTSVRQYAAVCKNAILLSCSKTRRVTVWRLGHSQRLALRDLPFQATWQG